ncbi:MAG TPA: response regulator [Candidatus Methylomirabilis sp.]
MGEFAGVFVTTKPRIGGGDGMRMQAKILLVEDDKEMRDLLAEVLRAEGCDIAEAADGAEGLLCLHRESFDAIILDKNMPGLSGLDLLPGIRTICPRTPVILITAFGDAQAYLDARQKGAFEFLFKPFRMEDLVAVLRQALASQGSPAGGGARGQQER